MEKLFLTILNNALVASWIILAVSFLKFVLRKMPKWIHCLLWGLVAVRLAIPFSIESVFSLVPSAKPIPADIEYAKVPQINSGIGVVNAVINPVLENNFTAQEIASVNPMQIVMFVLSRVWIVGVIILLAYAVFSFLFLQRRVRKSKTLEKGIFRSSAIDSPFILGVFRPRIYLPKVMDEEAYPCVIAHEKAHIKRGDHVWKPLGFLILTVYWFNPLCWFAYICLCRDIEYACDEMVTKDKDKEWKAKYCQALLDCSSQRHFVSACPVAFGEVSVKDRVKSVLNYKKPSFWILCISILIAIIVAVCFMTNPKVEIIEKDATVADLTKDALETSDNQNTADTVTEKDAATIYYQLIHTIEAAMYDPSLIENNPEAYKDAEGNGICSDEFFAHLYDGRDDIAYQNLGYLIQDIDEDGIEELLLGENDPNPDGGYNGIIYDLYTYREGKLQHIFSGWSRSRYYLTNSNEIICEWSSSSDEHGKTHYLYENGTLTEMDGWEDIYSYYLPQFTPMGPIWSQTNDLNEDGRPDYVIYTGMDGYYNHLSLYLTGEGKVFEHEDVNTVEIGTMLCAIDIDHDGNKEIALSIYPHVNSAELMKYAVLKKYVAGWKEMEIYTPENGENSFPIHIEHKEGFTNVIYCDGLDKKIEFDVEYYKKYWEALSNFPIDLKQDVIPDYDNLYHSVSGTPVGAVADWGMRDIHEMVYKGNDCLAASFSIEGFNKYDLWGYFSIFFDYEKNGKTIRILDIVFDSIKVELPETKYVNPENDNDEPEIELLPLESDEIDPADENMGVSYREHPINHTYKVEDLGDENLNVDYVKNNNHYIVEGDMVLQYKKVLEGHAPDSRNTIRYIVLTNDENVTWEQVYRSLHSDKNEDQIYGTIIIGIKEIAYEGNGNNGAKRSSSVLSEGVHPMDEEVKVFWRG